MRAILGLAAGLAAPAVLLATLMTVPASAAAAPIETEPRGVIETEPRP